MGSVIEFLEKYFVPFAGRIGSQRHLVAVRDGFVAIMPLVLVGALAVLINSFPIPAYQDVMNNIFGKSWKSFGANLWTGTFAIMALITVISTSFSLARSYNADGLAAALVSFGSLIMLYSGSEKDWAIPFGFLGAQGLFVALFVALISTEIFVKLMGNPRLLIKMPEGVPPAVAKSFAALIPSIVVLTLFGVLKCITNTLDIPNIHQAIFNAIQAPIAGLADHLGSAILVAFLVHILWFFGLHGTNILGPLLNAVYLPAINDNIAALQAGTAIPNIVTMPFFDAFVWMGGAGTTISLLAALFIAGKRKSNQSMAKLAAGPALFNINEPMMFGLPIVLNPLYLIPFVLTPIVLTIVTYMAIASGLVPKTIAMMPWTTPPVIGGFLVTGSVMGALLSFVNLVIGVILYIPFIILGERHENKSDIAAAKSQSIKGTNVRSEGV
ncbi:PTS sugar transporter subunit IIC [Pelosinus sp. IPA-1]|uniref:PTS sugar transporter subunit IIC n=1 Tax=Pelosinus sp. IPA-1 TaxID=3029569 RepID=UPI0024361649|nr:PTS sugar transporter subunit IIC [Pelosinus sp. IPA-1]GMA97824.1 permease IIC component [Pelosinus sp. IPA-1]